MGELWEGEMQICQTCPGAGAGIAPVVLHGLTQPELSGEVLVECEVLLAAFCPAVFA